MDCPSPQLSHAALAAFSPLNQQRLLSYLTQLAAQRYAPATLQAIPRTLTGFLRTLPPERHAIVAKARSIAWSIARPMWPRRSSAGSGTVRPASRCFLVRNAVGRTCSARSSIASWTST